MEFSPNGDLLIRWLGFSAVYRWEKGKLNEVSSARGPPGSLNHGVLAASAIRNSLVMFGTRTWGTVGADVLNKLGRYVLGVSVSPDGRFIAIVGDWSVQLWNVQAEPKLLC